MTIAHNQLRTIVERVERLNEEIDALNGDKKDVYAEAKANGFDVKALKAVVAERRKDPAAVAEFDALVDLYKAALGMLPNEDASRTRTREEKPDRTGGPSLAGVPEPAARSADESAATHPEAKPEEAGDAAIGAPANDAGSRPSRGGGTPAPISFTRPECPPIPEMLRRA